MTDDQKVAYINAMVACALIECAALKAENAEHLMLGQLPPHGKDEIMAIIDKYGISHNAVITTFRG